jgi:hypothetical protein
MKIDLNRSGDVWTVTTHVQRLSVKVLYGRGTEKKSIISEATVEVVWQVGRLASLVVQQTGVANHPVINQVRSLINL